MVVEFPVLSDTKRQMNQVIEAIFVTMMGRDCAQVAVPFRRADLCASVMFEEVCCQECEVTLGFDDADELVRMMTGAVDAGLRADMAGELCNMIAGGWIDCSHSNRESLIMQPPRVGPMVAEALDLPSSYQGIYSFGSGCFTVKLRCNKVH